MPEFIFQILVYDYGLLDNVPQKSLYEIVKGCRQISEIRFTNESGKL